ncbi:MAG TPA: BrxA/BrxB family bacilliredoxin, partial [Candidatus Eisenbacteria bacterium]|nr:BrxA/BrxB family bacilliredoxin [Candidatus Eisenbacteria bacterium]
MYPEEFVQPMRADLTSAGFEELRSADAVDRALTDKGTALVYVNSICGCSARMGRPAVKHAIQEASAKPDRLTTVFAGQDREATERARSYFTGYPPSSPSIALLRDGQLVWMMERWQIEGRPPQVIATEIQQALEEHCQM